MGRDSRDVSQQNSRRNSRRDSHENGDVAVAGGLPSSQPSAPFSDAPSTAGSRVPSRHGSPPSSAAAEGVGFTESAASAFSSAAPTAVLKEPTHGFDSYESGPAQVDTSRAPSSTAPTRPNSSSVGTSMKAAAVAVAASAAFKKREGPYRQGGASTAGAGGAGTEPSRGCTRTEVDMIFIANCISGNCAEVPVLKLLAPHPLFI